MSKTNWKLHLKEGNIRWYSGDTYDKECDNYEFTTTLTYYGYCRGCSACNIMFRSPDFKQTLYMFMTDFDEVVDRLINGKLSGTFTFCKRGMNYGIKMVK